MSQRNFDLSCQGAICNKLQKAIRYKEWFNVNETKLLTENVKRIKNKSHLPQPPENPAWETIHHLKQWWKVTTENHLLIPLLIIQTSVPHFYFIMTSNTGLELLIRLELLLKLKWNEYHLVYSPSQSVCQVCLSACQLNSVRLTWHMLGVKLRCFSWTKTLSSSTVLKMMCLYFRETLNKWRVGLVQGVWKSREGLVCSTKHVVLKILNLGLFSLNGKYLKMN